MLPNGNSPVVLGLNKNIILTSKNILSRQICWDEKYRNQWNFPRINFFIFRWENLRGKTTAYAFFVQEQKDEFQKANPEKKIVFGDFMKECGAKWRELEPEDKIPFEKQAAKDAKRWAREMEDYEPDDEPAKKKKKKKVINVYEYNFKINFYSLNLFFEFFVFAKNYPTECESS